MGKKAAGVKSGTAFCVGKIKTNKNEKKKPKNIYI